jgi:GNAT superfamily N-acetyltransferase
LKREIEAEPGMCGKLRLEEVKGFKRLQFILLEYHFFGDGKEGSALLWRLPWPLSPLSILLHIIESRAYTLLRLPCYFVKLEREIVGLFAMQERVEGLHVASLAVPRRFRRLGIGTWILSCIEEIARHMGKRRLEVEVLKRNIPAQRLYAEFGFTFIQSGKVRYLMRGEKPV